MKQSALKHPHFFDRYVEKVPEGSIVDLMNQAYSSLLLDLQTLKGVDFSYAYQQDKWSIAKLIRHCIDTEFIFGYRALCIAREYPNTIMSFDENEFALASGEEFNQQDLIDSFETARKQNLLLYKSFHPDWLQRSGKTESGEFMSLASVAYIIIGHWLHHRKILSTRYGVQF